MYRNKRDRDYGGHHGGGRGRYHDDRGGTFGRGGGGGRGNPAHNRPTEAQVVVNYNKLNIIDPSSEVGIDVYKVTIKSAYNKERHDQDGNKVLDNSGRVQREFVAREKSVCDDEKFKKRFFSSEKPWQIYKKLLQDQRACNSSFELFYNGAELAYAPSGFGPSEVDSTYRVCIKKDCDFDHPEAHKVKNEWFEVALSKTHTIPASYLAASIDGGGSRVLTSDLATAINVIMKSAGVKQGMLPVDSQPTSLFFPLEEQPNMFSRNRMIETASRDKFLLSGVKQTAFFSQSGCYIQTDPLVAWYDKEKYNFDAMMHEQEGGIKLIQRDLIMGLSPQRDRTQIEAIISKMKLNFYYTILKPDAKREEREDNMLARGKTSKDIEGSRRRVFLNQSVKMDPDSKSKIKWSPNDHTFQKDGVETTVTQHYLDTYGIQLNTNLPIVFLGQRIGWLPLEFAYQVFAKTKGSNETEMVQQVLRYYDSIAGTGLRDQMRDKRVHLSRKISGSLAKFNLSVADDPVVLRARILQAPVIQFDRHQTANVANGSFNLRGVSFPSPGELESFAVINYTGDPNAPRDYIPRQFKVNVNHGMGISEQTHDVASRYLNSVTETPQKDMYTADRVPEATRRAIKRAKDVFLYDKHDIFKKVPASWHKTTCSRYGKVANCLVLPPGTTLNPSTEVGLMFEPNDRFDDDTSLKLHCTHDIELSDGRQCDRARLKIKCRENRDLIDPFDVVVARGKPQYQGRDIIFDGYAFLCHLTNGKVVPILNVKEVAKVEPLHPEKKYEIKCPTVIFEIKPDDSKELYERIKSLNNTVCGVQTQCVVYNKYRNQKNPDQYASNIAVKLNTKLSGLMDRTAAWNSSPLDGNVPGIQWIGEASTLVIGIGLVHGMGYDANTVVASYSSLDSQCMSFASSAFLQKKSDSVNKYTMFDIIKTSIQKYGSIPLRLVIYRDGMSDGNFDKADDEIEMIREAVKSESDVSCTCKRGCRMCCPPITFVICQSQNSVRVVPSSEEEGYPVRSGGVNVHSGTVVDDLVMELGTLLSISNEDVSSIQASNQSSKQILGTLQDSYDFILTAQGGLKGTSKPIYYRVRLNENALWGPVGATSLTKENLMNVTYQMSFKYGTATKATRDIPLIKYAKKLGNQVLHAVKYLREDKFYWNYKDYTLEFPVESADDDADNRPFIREVFKNGSKGTEEECKRHNLIFEGFYNHLAA